MKLLETITQPYCEGKACIVLTGRDLNDLDINPSGHIQPVIEILRSRVLNEHGLVLVEYSKSRGIVWDGADLTQKERDQVNKTLNDLGIVNNSGTQSRVEETEFVRIMRALIRLSQTDHKLFLRDGVPLRFMLIIGFAEHIIPCLQAGTHTEEQMLAIETALQLARSLAVRKSGNYVVFSEARAGMLEGLIYQNIPTVNLSQPSLEEKACFLKALQTRYTKSSAEEGLTDKIICNLSANTPNRSLESIFLASERTEKKVTAQDVFAKRQSDLISLSEGTLEPIDYSRVDGQKLVGRTILKPMEILGKLAERLKRGDRTSFRNVLLCGSPSGGKTVLANVAAGRAGVPSFNLVSPKSQYVGESERKAKLMLRLLKEQGGFGLIDEVELILPLNRGAAAHDGGVTQNLIGQLQSFLSDPSLAGKCALIGTSNKPHSISEAMRQRWTIVPVLSPLPEDYHHIILSIATGINPSIDLRPDDERLKEAAKQFCAVSVTPRGIQDALINSQIEIPGPLGIEHIEFAAMVAIPDSGRQVSIFSDYCALAYTRSLNFLPWYDSATRKPDPNYPYPDYIQDVLTKDFMIDQAKLQARIRELEPYCNV